MKLKLFLFPRAEADLDSHFDWLAQENPEIALAFDSAAFRSLEQLCQNPLLGSEREYDNAELIGLRIWFVKGFERYLIFYRVFGSYLEIVRVLHSLQDRDSILEEAEN